METQYSLKVLITLYQTIKHHIVEDNRLLSNSYCINVKAYYFDFRVISHKLSISFSRAKDAFNQKNQGLVMFSYQQLGSFNISNKNKL
jgi:hypothetical protein